MYDHDILTPKNRKQKIMAALIALKNRKFRDWKDGEWPRVAGANYDPIAEGYEEQSWIDDYIESDDESLFNNPT